MSTVQIGWVIIEEDQVFHNASFSTAAWWEDVLVKAGKYPAYVHDPEIWKNGRLWCHGVYATLPGTVVADYFASLYFGMPISDYDTKKNAGKQSRYTMHMYDYMFAEAILYEEERERWCKGHHFELLPEYEAREHTFTTSDGREVKTGAIYKKEA